MRGMDPNDFYEDDEPVEKIVAAFNRGEKGTTKRPPQGYNLTLTVPGLAPIMSKAVNRTLGTVSGR